MGKYNIKQKAKLIHFKIETKLIFKIVKIKYRETIDTELEEKIYKLGGTYCTCEGI